MVLELDAGIISNAICISRSYQPQIYLVLNPYNFALLYSFTLLYSDNSL